MYLCTLTGLKPGTTYHYRVIVGDHKTNDRTFRTAPTAKEDFTFAVWGDSQSITMVKGENQPVTAIVQHIKKSNASFAIAVGDMSPNGRFYKDVRQCVLDTVCKQLGQTIPFMITWGNHDGKRNELIRTYLPANNGTYSFDYAGCHFLCIDMYDRNYTFIEKDLKQARDAKARHIFVFMHHPPSDSKDFVMCKEYLTTLIPMMKKYGAEACFCGHWHRYQHFTVGGVQCYVTGGGNMGSEPSPHYLQVHVNAKGWTVTKHSFFEIRKR